jgi:hypothetical protein
MARGWESKAVEAQQDEATRAARPGPRVLTADERARDSARRTLELARAKLQGDLDRARTDAHRTMLRRALDDVERQLSAKSDPSTRLR